MSIKAAFAVPHPPIIMSCVGRGKENEIADTIASYKEVARRIEALAPDTIIITSPHSVMYADYFHISPGNGARGDFAMFGAPGTSENTEYDVELTGEIISEAEAGGIPAGTLGERDKRLDHGTLIPLSFIKERYSDFRTVRIGLSGLSAEYHYRLGMCIKKAAGNLGRSIVFVASGDLSHKLLESGPYGFAEEGPKFDADITDAFKKGDFARLLGYDESFCNAAAECGLKSFQIMAGALDGLAVKSELLSYEGPFGVGYGVAAFTVTGEDASRRFLSSLRQDDYAALAKKSLEHYIKTGNQLDVPVGLGDDLLNRTAGVFVSLKKNGELRGCIGTISPAMPSVAEEIIRNAVLAGTDDPRFPEVGEDELPLLRYSVDVLFPPEPIESADELDVKEYGVIVTSGYRRGLLLPNLEGVDTPEQQIAIAMRKAGIAPGENIELERFRVVRHK